VPQSWEWEILNGYISAAIGHQIHFMFMVWGSSFCLCRSNGSTWGYCYQQIMREEYNQIDYIYTSIQNLIIQLWYC